MRLARMAAPHGPRFAMAGGAGRWLDLGEATLARQESLLRGEPTSSGGELDPGLPLLSPIQPNRIFAVGRNYLAHAEERGEAVPEIPIIWVKLNSAVIASGEPLRLPPEHQRSIDYEGELAVVIGHPGRRIPGSEALSHVAGYTIANDITARDAQDLMSQWVLPKSMAGFAPLGPHLLSAEDIPDPQLLTVETRVGGELRQRAETRDMIFPVAQLLSFISGYVALETGDVVETGTPAGTGWSQKPRTMLRPGLEVEVRIAPIGELRNPVELEQAVLGV